MPTLPQRTEPLIISLRQSGDNNYNVLHEAHSIRQTYCSEETDSEVEHSSGSKATLVHTLNRGAAPLSALTGHSSEQAID